MAKIIALGQPLFDIDGNEIVAGIKKIEYDHEIQMFTVGLWRGDEKKEIQITGEKAIEIGFVNPTALLNFINL